MENLGITQNLDILVRTANEHRLSNFMLAQCPYAYICILKETWPEIGLFSFIRIMFEFNYCSKQLAEAKGTYEARKKGGFKVGAD